MKIEEKILELLAQSEARMDRTNEMCCQLSKAAIHLENVMSTLTEEYSTHLRNVATNRESMLSLWKMQSEAMQQQLEFLRGEVQTLHQRNDQLIQILLKNPSNAAGSGNTNINVK